MARRNLMAACALACACAGAGAQEDGEAHALAHTYAGAAASAVLPQGGAGMRPLAGATLRLGWYAVDTFALEGAASWLEDRTGLAAKALWHLQGWEAWGRLFGYERFDPFLTAGVQGWLDHGQVGPTAGLGAFYYLTDNWALRADADVTLGLDSAPAAVYTLSAGVQYDF